MENVEEKQIGQVARGVINIEDRKRFTASSVRSMGAATKSTVTCVTSLGGLTLKGGDLHVLKFSQDEGVLIVQGSIDSVVYSSSAVKQPMWKRMWK